MFICDPVGLVFSGSASTGTRAVGGTASGRTRAFVVHVRFVLVPVCTVFAVWLCVYQDSSVCCGYWLSVYQDSCLPLWCVVFGVYPVMHLVCSFFLVCVGPIVYQDSGSVLEVLLDTLVQRLPGLEPSGPRGMRVVAIRAVVRTQVGSDHYSTLQ